MTKEKLKRNCVMERKKKIEQRRNKCCRESTAISIYVVEAEVVGEKPEETWACRQTHAVILTVQRAQALPG